MPPNNQQQASPPPRQPSAALARAKAKANELADRARNKLSNMKEDLEGIKARATGAAAGLAGAHFYGDYVGKKELEGKPIPTLPVINVPVVRAAGFTALGLGVAGYLDDDATNIQACLVGMGLAAADLALTARMKRIAAGLPAPAGGGGAAGGP
jgi:hypothetical protein